jgi:hypothetical protein
MTIKILLAGVEMNCSCGFILAETEANLAVHTRKLSEIESEVKP